MDVTVIVTTWGGDEWDARGHATAQQHGAWHHHETNDVSAGGARNRAVDDIRPQGFICFLDADDSLAPGYLKAMWGACEHERQLLTPALALGDSKPVTFSNRDILNGMNPCPIGTLIHRDLFDEVAGFRDEPAYEDYSMFQRAVLIGAEIRFVPEAVYLAAHNPRGRNSTVKNPKQLVQQIWEDNQRWLQQRA